MNRSFTQRKETHKFMKTTTTKAASLSSPNLPRPRGREEENSWMHSDVLHSGQGTEFPKEGSRCHYSSLQVPTDLSHQREGGESSFHLDALTEVLRH